MGAVARALATIIQLGVWLCIVMQNQTLVPSDRAAYSPAQFAAACGKSATWTYRLLYAGKLKAVTKFGRLLIPATEMNRLMATAEPYDPQPKTKKEQKQEVANVAS